MLDAFLVGALATYGLAYTVAQLHGPFGLFHKLRMWADTQSDWIHKGFYCEICLSFWIGMPVALVVVGFVPVAIAHWLGYVGFAVFANVALNHLRTK